MNRLHLLFKATIVVLFALVCAPADAALLTDDRLAQAVGSSVIEIASGSNYTHLGYGVVISTTGDVLSVPHVVESKPASLWGRVVPVNENERDTPKWFKLQIVDAVEKQDILLLKFSDGLGIGMAPAQLRGAYGSRPLSSPAEYRFVSGTDETRLRNVYQAKATLSVQTNDRSIQLVGPAWIGHSGSPIFDQTGALIGLVARGTPGLFWMRPVSAVAVWLRDRKGISFSSLPAPPAQTKLLVKIDEDFAHTNGLADLYIPLTELMREVGKYFTPEAQAEDRSVWREVAGRAFKSLLSADERKNDISAFLNSQSIKNWLAREDAIEIYLLAVNVRPEMVQYALLRIEHQVNTVSLDANFGEEVRLISKERDYLNDVTVRQVRLLLRNWPHLIRNKIVLADCFDWLMANQREAWMTDSVEEFGSKLNNIWQGVEGEQHYTAIPAKMQKCLEASDAKRDWLASEHLAEIMIKVSFAAERMRWQAKFPWDDKKNYPGTPNWRKIDKPTPDVIKNLTGELVTEIGKSWEDVLKVAR